MSKRIVNPAFTPLIEAAPKRDADWLKILLSSKEAVSMYATLDSEMFSLESNVPSSVLITSAVKGEGRTSIAVLFAAFSAIQNSQRKILLVDADLGTGGLANTFGLGDKPGLYDFFNGEADVNQYVHKSALSNLWITPLGDDENDLGLLSPEPFKNFMTQACSKFDLVIVDGPAASVSRSVSTMAKIINNCVLVIRYSGPTREQVSALNSELDRVGVNVLGSILNQREFVIPGFLYGSR